MASPQHSYTGSGTYTVQLISCAADRCDTTSQAVFISAAGELISLQPVQLYPNPATDEVIVQCQLPAGTEQAMLILYDVMGRQVYRQPLAQPQGQNHVPLHTLGTGMYYYQVQADGQEAARGKLMVVR